MQRRAAVILLVITPALLMTSCKSSSKSKVTILPKLSAPALAPASTAPAPSSSAPATPTAAPPAAPATSAPASPSPTPPPTASAPASISASGSPENLDPCQLVTQSEASTLAGATFGPGQESTISASSKECVYGAQTTNVMDVIVAQADSPATAQAVYAQELGEAQTLIATRLPPGVHVNLVTSSASVSPSGSANPSSVGDEASSVTGSTSILGKTIAFSGIYVISGSTFFTIGDLVLSAPAPTQAAIAAQAQTVIGRI